MNAIKQLEKQDLRLNMLSGLMTEHKTFPDWIVGDGGIIPSIDPTDDEDDD
jgi:hypothetical protein